MRKAMLGLHENACALVTAPALITFGSAVPDLLFPDDEPALYKSAGLWYIWRESILCLFSRNVGRVLTHPYITQQIWGSDWESNIASLRVVTATLRKKLETGADSPQYIQTHIGVGIRMIRAEEQV